MITGIDLMFMTCILSITAISITGMILSFLARNDEVDNADES